MIPSERRAASSLALIYALRMIGLFMVFPVLALYATDLKGATPALVGLAIGIYGLTQGLLQIPFGLLSDRWGRKPVIVMGLLVFAGGSVVAALSDSIFVMILGRALQGSGAIAAAIMALAADLTREEQRTKIMAIIGISIGASFSLAILLGPVLDGWIGLSGIFWLTAFLALVAIGVVALVVPTPAVSRVHRDAETVPSQLKGVLRDRQLLRLDVGILILHLILTANFVVLPLMLHEAGLAAKNHWLVYLPVLLLSVVFMVPMIIVAEKYRRMKQVFLASIAGIVLAQGFFALEPASVFGLGVTLLLFFAAFNVLEASLPSLISKIAPPDAKGSAMGVYSSSQFIGSFIGGAVGGSLYQVYGAPGVFIVTVLLAVLWWVLAMSMRQPGYLSSYLLNIGETDQERAESLAERLARVAGVAEAVVVADEGVAYLKVDRRALDESALLEYRHPA